MTAGWMTDCGNCWEIYGVSMALWFDDFCWRIRQMVIFLYQGAAWDSRFGFIKGCGKAPTTGIFPSPKMSAVAPKGPPMVRHIQISSIPCCIIELNMLKDFWCNCCLGVSHLWLRVLVWDHRQEQVSLEIFQLPRVELFYQQVCVITCVYVCPSLGDPFLYIYIYIIDITNHIQSPKILHGIQWCRCTFFFAHAHGAHMPGRDDPMQSEFSNLGSFGALDHHDAWA